jgi:hypothetical protein
VDVGEWLNSLGLDQYEAAFRENAVDAEVLPRLTTDDLKEMGVVPIGHRRHQDAPPYHRTDADQPDFDLQDHVDIHGGIR